MRCKGRGEKGIRAYHTERRSHPHKNYCSREESWSKLIDDQIFVKKPETIGVKVKSDKKREQLLQKGGVLLTKSRSKVKEYDFTFVLPEFVFAPGGGYMVVFELYHKLIENGYKACIIFLKNVYRGLYNISRDEKVIAKSREFPLNIKIFNSVKGKTLTRIMIDIIKRRPGIIRSMGFQINLDSFNKYIAKDLDFFILKSIPKNFRTKRIIASAWETAYFVNNFENCDKKYYLAQHNEDDPSYSGELSSFAERSYSFELKKVVINDYMFKRFEKEDPIRISVAPHIEGRVIHSPEERGDYVLMQLREGESKGAKYGIEAAELITKQKEGVHIMSYGDFSGTIPSFIKHHGYVSNQKYIDLFNSASVFILPSLVEGFSTPVLEAMASGCVPVATRSKGPEELIEDGVNGYLVPIKDPISICEKVIYLLNNKEKRIRIAHEGVERSKEYTDEKMYNSFINGILKFESKTGS